MSTSLSTPGAAAGALRCNACLGAVSSGPTFKTVCGHLFCGTCARGAFDRPGYRLACPVCSTPLDADRQEIVELVWDASPALEGAILAFVLLQPRLALGLLADAFEFHEYASDGVECD